MPAARRIGADMSRQRSFSGFFPNAACIHGIPALWYGKKLQNVFMMKSRISVIVAVYRGEKYIAQQLESLFHQTRIPDEILIGDDSPDDASFQVIESIRDQFPCRLRYIRNSPRLGFLRNFISLANQAKGDLIFFCDQDDIWLPRKIETLAEVLERDPSGKIAVCNSEMMDVEGNSFHETLLDGISNFPEIIRQINAGKGFFPLINQSVQLSGHNMAVRRDFVPILNQIPEHYTVHDLWMQHAGALLGVLRYVDQPLTRFRIHAGNTSTPKLKKVRNSLFHRFGEIRRSANDIFLTADWIHDLARFMEQACPASPNGDFLRGYDRYFVRRTELLRRNQLVRLLLLSVHPSWIRDYLRYGVGVRSLLRDLISRTVR